MRKSLGHYLRDQSVDSLFVELAGLVRPVFQVLAGTHEFIDFGDCSGFPSHKYGISCTEQSNSSSLSLGYIGQSGGKVADVSH
jgi:hypothetical protein